MMSTISDTLATVRDTVARVKILEKDTIKFTAEQPVDTASVEVEETEPAEESPRGFKDILDSVWTSCYTKPTINLAAEPSDTTYEAYIPQHTPGVPGIPNNQKLSGSDIVTSLVLVCFFVTMTFLSVSRSYISVQTKKFFGKITDRGSFTAETINEVKLNIYFVIQTCIFFSIITYILSSSVIDFSKLKIPSITIIPAATLVFLIYFAFKFILYIITDVVFNKDNKNGRHHTDDICYIITAQGMLLLPLLLLVATTGIDTYTLVIYVASVIVFAKLIAFYKAFGTFSGHYKKILQIILYFCALEMTPLMSLYGILAMTAKYL